MKKREKQALAALKKLWSEYESAKFPRGLLGQEIAGLDLVVLDANVAGCIETFLSRKRQLDTWRTAVLGKCYRELATVIAELSGSARAYFARLERLAGLVLDAIIAQSAP